MSSIECPFCGSRSTEETEPLHFHCTECGRDFCSELKTEQGEKMKEHISDIFFSIGSMSSSVAQMHIQNTPQGTVYEIHGGGPDQDRSVQGRMEKDAWEDFSRALCEECSLDEWEENYMYDMNKHGGVALMDGLEWILNIQSDNGKTRSWHGWEDYPGSWDAFAALIQPYIDLASIEE